MIIIHVVKTEASEEKTDAVNSTNIIVCCMFVLLI